jgi:hypothetical protein
MKNLFKRILDKKEPTKDDKLVNLYVKLIKDNYFIEERTNEDDSFSEYSIDDSWGGLIFYYDKKSRRLYYTRRFSDELYEWIADNRLIQSRCELMGKIFEKLYKNKVRDVYDYNNMSSSLRCSCPEV